MPYYLILSQNKNPFISVSFFSFALRLRNSSHYITYTQPLFLFRLVFIYFFPFLSCWLILVEWWSSIITGITWLCFLSKQRKVRNLRKKFTPPKKAEDVLLTCSMFYVCMYFYVPVHATMCLMRPNCFLIFFVVIQPSR